VDKNTKDRIKQALIKAIQKSGKAAFIKSQTNCPVDSGDLNKSGSNTDLPNGAEVAYRKEYASMVERGVQAGNRHIHPHVRAGKVVKGYSYYSRGQPAQQFIRKAFDEEFNNFSNNFDNELRISLSGSARRITH